MNMIKYKLNKCWIIINDNYIKYSPPSMVEPL